MNTRPDGNESSSAPRWTEQERQRFAAMLEPARKAAGLSQEDVAEMSGVSRRTIGNAERGDKIPQSSILRRLMIAVDLYDDRANPFSVDTRRWLAVVGPLVEQLPEGSRDSVMSGVVNGLSQEVMRLGRLSTLSVVPPAIEEDVSQAAYRLAAHTRDIQTEHEGFEEAP